METIVIEKVLEQLKDLPQEMQWRVLEFTRALAVSTPRGVPGRQLLHFAGVISPEEAASMRETIEQACEQVDAQTPAQRATYSRKRHLDRSPGHSACADIGDA